MKNTRNFKIALIISILVFNAYFPGSVEAFDNPFAEILKNAPFPFKKNYKQNLINEAQKSERSGNRKKTFDLYERINNLYPNSPDVLQAYASFCERSKYYLKAIQLNQKLYSLTKQEKYLIKVARLYAAQGNVSKSIQVYNSILKNNPNNTNVVKNLISFYYNSAKFSNAARICDKYLKPDFNSRYKLICGKSYFYSKNPHKAKILVDSYISQNGSSYDNLKLLVDISTADGDYAKAGQTLEKMIRMRPYNTDLKSQLAGIYMKAGAYRSAANVYKSILSSRPNNPKALTDLMDCYLAAKDYRNAERIMEKLARIYPNSYKIKKSLSDTYMSHKKYAKANKVLRSMPQLNRNERLLNNLSYTYMMLNNYEKAAVTKERILALRPNDISFKKEVAFLYLKAKNNEKAIKLFNEILRARPNDKKILETKADLSLDIENFQEAASTFKKLVSIDPKNKKYRLKLGESYMALGNYSDAVPVFSALAGMAPNNATYKVKLGEAYMALENYQEARRVFQKALVLDENNTKILNYLVDSSSALHDYSTASSYMFKVVTLSKGSPDEIVRLKSKLAGLYMSGQDFKNAEILLTDISYLHPEDITVLDMLSDAYSGQQKFNEAAIILRKVIQLSPDSINSKIKLAKVYVTLKRFLDARNLLEGMIADNNETLVLLNNKTQIAQDATNLSNQVKSGDKNKAQDNEFAVKNVQENVQEIDISLKGLVEKYPYVIEALSTLSDAYLGEGNYDEALYTADKLLSLSPNNQDFLMKKGNIYLISGKFDKSAEVFKGLVTKYPDNLTYVEYLANSYLAMEDFKAAIDILKPIVTSNRRNVRLAVKYAEALNAYNEFDESKRFLLDAEKVYPDNLDVKELIGDTSLAMEDFNTALNYYSLIYEKSKTDRIKFKLAETLRYLNNFDRSEKLYMSLKDSVKYREKAASGIGHIRIGQNKILKAREIFENIHKVNPESFDAKFGLAVTYISTEDFLKALNLLDSLSENDKRVKMKKALTYEKMGMPNKSMFYLKTLKSREANQLLKIVVNEMRVDLQPQYDFRFQGGDNDRKLNIFTYGFKISKNIGHNINIKETTLFNNYRSRYGLGNFSMAYLFGLDGRPFKRFNFDSNIGFKTFSQGKDAMLVSKVDTNYYFNDAFKLNLRFTRDNVLDSYFSAVGTKLGQFSSQDDFLRALGVSDDNLPDEDIKNVLNGQVVDNKFSSGYTLKLPHYFFNYGGYNLGYKKGLHVPGNFYQEATLGLGKILYTRPRGALVDLVMPELTTYYTGYNKSRSITVASSEGTSEYPIDAPFYGGYFSPKYMIANKAALHLRGTFDKLNTGYYVYGYAGEQNIANDPMKFIWGSKVSLIFNEKGRFGLGLNYMVEDYRAAMRHDYYMNLIMRL